MNRPNHESCGRFARDFNGTKVYGLLPAGSPVCAVHDQIAGPNVIDQPRRGIYRKAPAGMTA